VSTQFSAPDAARQLLRHTVATLAYRGSKVLRDTPADFSSFTCGSGCRSAGAILAHIGDLLDWGLSLANGERKWRDSQPRTWEEDVHRFHAALAAFDATLASDQPLHAPVEKLFQGPVADALTHVGQIAVMRRLAGAPIKGENYFAAEIAAGRVGPEQAAPKREF
jgi:CubicO group peptidase (beta-lactamase class C family)